MPPPASKSLRVAGVLWLVALVPGAGLALLLAVFALSPTQCPDTGGALLCRRPEVGSWVLCVVVVGLLAAVGASAAAVAARTTSRQVTALVLSAVLAVAAVAVIGLAAASWT